MTSLVVLPENTARGLGVLGEHGLSWWLDTGGRRVLFDTGQGLVLGPNAQRLGIDLSTADAIVLSHGHGDHVGGLPLALSAAPGASLHYHPDARVRRYSGSDGPRGARRLSTELVESGDFGPSGRRVVASREPQEIAPGLWATGEIPRVTPHEDTGGPFFLDEAMTAPDPLLDDQALFFLGRHGTVVVLGCAHAGVVNTLLHVRALTGGAPVHAVLGGMHLERASATRLDATVRFLQDLGVRMVGPCHCTGVAAIHRFHGALPGRCVQPAAGTRWSFD